MEKKLNQLSWIVFEGGRLSLSYWLSFNWFQWFLPREGCSRWLKVKSCSFIETIFAKGLLKVSKVIFLLQSIIRVASTLCSECSCNFYALHFSCVLDSLTCFPSLWWINRPRWELTISPLSAQVLGAKTLARGLNVLNKIEHSLWQAYWL